MRAALWLLALFATAVAVALFAGDNQATVTLFWAPWRVDLSLNLVLLVLAMAFVVLHLALRALAALFELPARAQAWRAQQRERAAHAALVESLAALVAGRFTRSRKAAAAVLARLDALAAAPGELAHAGALRALAHLVAAQSAHALQDRNAREEQLQAALGGAQAGAADGPVVQELREGARLQAARWSLDERDAEAALTWLDSLPQGAQRRTLALRIRLKASRLAHRVPEALDTARLLAKHRAFTPQAAQTLVRSLVADLLKTAHDPAQLQRLWAGLPSAEQRMPEVAMTAARRLLALGEDVARARSWLEPVWQDWVREPSALPAAQAERLTLLLERCLVTGDDEADRAWLARIEAAHQAHARDVRLQHLAGMACRKRQLWGKAELLLRQAVAAADHEALSRSAWRARAELAEQRGDADAALHAWRQAARA